MASVDQQVADQLRAQYGYMAAFLDIPEVGDLLRQANAEGWTPDKLQAGLQATNWWKQHSDTTRQWVALQQTDPATAQKQIDQQKAAIQQEAAKDGLNLSPDRLNQMANDALEFGWSGDQLTKAIGSEYHYNPNLQQQPKQVFDLKAAANQYMVPLSPQTLQDWTQNILGGTQTQDNFVAYLQAQAKSLFPAMSGAIDRGTTPLQYVDPYRQVAAKELEINPEDIDFMDPKWNKAVNQIDPKSNERTSMNLSDWTNEIRSNPAYGYDFTNNARTQAAQMETQLLQKMGAVA